MKYFLLPVTLIGWYLVSYLSLWLIFSGITFICQLSWLWIILGFTILIGVVSVLGFGIPTAIKTMILKLYSTTTTNILHAIAGLLGVVSFVMFLFEPHVKQLISDIWNESKWKVIINFFPFLGLFVGTIISNIAFFKTEDLD